MPRRVAPTAVFTLPMGIRTFPRVILTAAESVEAEDDMASLAKCDVDG